MEHGPNITQCTVYAGRRFGSRQHCFADVYQAAEDLPFRCYLRFSERHSWYRLNTIDSKMLRQPSILRFRGPSTKPRMSGDFQPDFYSHFPATLHLFESWSSGNEIQAYYCCRLREAQRLAQWLCFAPTGPCLVTQTTKPVIASAGGHVWNILSAADAKLLCSQSVGRTGESDRGGGCLRRDMEYPTEDECSEAQVDRYGFHYVEGPVRWNTK
ncbi:hypothetical protein VTJ04DRAFT_2168 [Mycothermus thermophilus]|uniref:uncharacterized protein n=1 Tax=Humicola insolens TaxID=85995 RepID=UPI0037428594